MYKRQNLLKLLEPYQGFDIWGVKDPRTLLVLDGWRAVTKPKFIGTFRHPNEVAASLVYRAKVSKKPMEMDAAYDLWAAYNQRLLAIYDEVPFDIIRYDVKPSVYNEKLSKIAQNLGLNTELIKNFRDQELHNQHNTDESIPSRLKSIWEALNDITL